MLSVQEYAKIYSMLDKVSPVSYDCGRLCNSICCSNETFADEDSYIYLLPGEMEYLASVGCNIPIVRQAAKDHFLPASWGRDVYLMNCPDGTGCDRRFRPIQCRTFPLAPHLKKKGVLELISCDTDLPYVCPLIRDDIALNDDFREATLEAWKLLIEDKAIRDLVKMDSKERRRRLP